MTSILIPLSTAVKKQQFSKGGIFIYIPYWNFSDLFEKPSINLEQEEFVTFDKKKRNFILINDEINILVSHPHTASHKREAQINVNYPSAISSSHIVSKIIIIIEKIHFSFPSKCNHCWQKSASTLCVNEKYPRGGLSIFHII